MTKRLVVTSFTLLILAITLLLSLSLSAMSSNVPDQSIAASAAAATNKATDTTTATTAPAPSIKALSSWTNQRGSTLTIDSIDSNGMLSGTYINRAAGFDCQNIAYPVTGWVYGTAITFTTIWQNVQESCNSITAWTGFYYNGEISSLWQLVKNGSTDPAQIMQGQDSFTQTQL